MFAVLAAAVLVGSISQWIARDLVKDNMEQLQLPALLKQIGKLGWSDMLIKANVHLLNFDLDDHWSMCRKTCLLLDFTRLNGRCEDVISKDIINPGLLCR